MAAPRRKPQSRRRKETDDMLSTVPALVHDAQVTTLINLAARLTNKAARLRLGNVGAWPGQIPILLWLMQEDGIIQRDLVERAKMEQSSVAEHLERMERDGLVYRRQVTDDRRMFRIYLTPKARDLSTDVIEQLEEGARAFTQNIPEADLAVFETVIRQIIANITDFVESYEPAVETTEA